MRKTTNHEDSDLIKKCVTSFFCLPLCCFNRNYYVTQLQL